MIPFRTILVAADLSDSSRQAFQVACSLARENRTRLVVLNVMEPKYVPETPVYLGQQTVQYHVVTRDRSEHESLEQQLRQAYRPNQPLDVEYRTQEGDAAEEILHGAKAIGCDLIVMGTHGRKGLSRLLAGSIAEKVLRKADCPVLALQHHETPQRDKAIRVIVHPTDFSAGSEAALRVARQLARDHGARLIVLHVTPSEFVLDGTVMIGVDPHVDRDSLELIRGRMDGSDLKYPVATRLEQGEPATEILRAAEKVECDLIVMGTHGRTGLARVFMGSVAETVLRGADCAVLVVKDPVPAAAAASSVHAGSTPL